MTHRFRGFTLVELVVTVTLLGVLLTIAIPGLQQLTLNQGVKSAAFDLFSALEYARSVSITRPGVFVTL
jgi:prepilin-type N-terminal cleavage/methylation domain-containing protein